MHVVCCTVGVHCAVSAACVSADRTVPAARCRFTRTPARAHARLRAHARARAGRVAILCAGARAAGSQEGGRGAFPVVYSLLRACRRRRPRLRWQNLIVSVCCCALSCALLSADLLHVACYRNISAAHRPLHLGSIMSVVPFISSAARRPLRVVRCTSSAARCPLFMVWCMVFAACRLLHVVC